MSEHETGTTRANQGHLGGANGLETSAYGYLLGYVREKNACTHSGWSEDRVEILTREWATGKSASQIAKILGGVTRNAVIGKVCRMGLPKRQEPQKPRRAPKEFVLPPFKRTVGNPLENALAAATANALAREAEKASEVVVPFAKIWTERGAGCTWIVSGRGAESMACCKRVFARGWCAEHHKLGVDQKPVSAKELARGLRRYL